MNGAHAQADWLRRRHTDYQRYAELVVRQLHALQEDDMQEVVRLGHEREDIVQGLASDPTPDLTTVAETDETLGRLIQEARATLNEATEADRVLQEGLRRVVRDTRAEIDTLQGRRTATQAYLNVAAQVTTAPTR